MNTDRLRLAVMSLSWLAAGGSAHADFSISKRPTHDVSCSAGVCTPTGMNAVLNVDDLIGLLASGDLIVETSDDLNTAGGIDIVASVRWSSSARLTLSARHNIFVRAPISVAGRGALTIAYGTYNPDSDLLFQKKGRIRFSHLESQLVINGQTYVMANTLSSLSAAIGENSEGFFALASDYDAAPDGVYSSGPIYSLSGVLNGLGNTIQNLTVKVYRKHTTSAPVRVNYGIIRDLNLTDVTISSGPNKTTGSGGLVGLNYGTIRHCFVSGHLQAEGSAGGLVAHNVGPIIASHTATTIQGGLAAGGLVGYGFSGGAVIQSYATGAVDGGRAGGLVGDNAGLSVENSYSTGVVHSGGEAGGLVGVHESHGRIVTSYATGEVVGHGDSYAGGLIGMDGSSNDAADYWDMDTSGLKHGCGYGPCEGVVRLTDDQLKLALPDGFDPKIWASNPNINNGYPYLVANPPQ